MRDRDHHLEWCLKQSKGIQLSTPSEDLVRAYLTKSRTALKSMDINVREGIDEWAIDTSYYAKYYVVYALFQRLGIKCEIHDCTIALFEYLFDDRISPRLIQEFRRSKEDRIEAQYYPLTGDSNLTDVVKQTKAFVLEIEKLMDGLDAEHTKQLQRTLHDLRNR